MLNLFQIWFELTMNQILIIHAHCHLNSSHLIIGDIIKYLNLVV